MTRFAPYLFSLMLLFVTACGGGSDDQQQTETQESQTTAQQADDGVRTIEIVGIDRMKFVVEGDEDGISTGDTMGDYVLLESITAEPGEEIRIRLTTESTLPASAMAHNFVLLVMDADATAFANAAARAKDNEYIPADMEDQIIAHTDMAAGGETVEVTFTAPEEAGDYEFICSFPGHYSGGMAGTLTVE
ncbi:plastocyanin/azurin family copper-binding protein [Aliifodinibius salicampi]|uniref:Plastocyanin/azurin family copper-binding protein n=1 Tax=Fodinibius salicampi TaxID=1920655 RepID=A0ABT3PXR3_9BACT|nr:plastocyanin/azurin family copper-binding protein [Fodinibius salicampi]MCW9712576.1 plastocyanin/azurin family copper-binding protein [Fodinibius salicampi]